MSENFWPDEQWAAVELKPTPPSNVRIVYPNGTEVSCPVKYLGWGDFGQDGEPFYAYGWRVLNEGPFDAREGHRIVYDWGSVPMYIECPGTGVPDESPLGRGVAQETK